MKKLSMRRIKPDHDKSIFSHDRKVRRDFLFQTLPLYYNSRICSQAAMKFSCCQTYKFVRVGLPGRQERCENAVALLGHLPAIGAGNFGNQAMSVQQCQSPRDFGGLGALLLFVVGLPKQQGPDVAVAKALQSPFATVDGG